MATLKAKLVEKNLIEVSIKNTFYHGKTTTLTLKKGNDLSSLDIIDKKVNTHETIYYTRSKEHIQIGVEYEVLDDHCLKTPLLMDAIVRTKTFDEMFYYEGFLGNNYHQDKTVFKVWSPIATEVKLDLLYPCKKRETIEMVRGEKGVWSATVLGDLEYVSYVYLLKVNASWNEATDPYAYSSTPNNKRSVVIDLEKTNLDLNRDKLRSFTSFTDTVIYEMHVRDFTSNPNGNIKNKGKFLGVIEEGTKSNKGISTGFDYLKYLGITHVQLLPVYDFGSVDEENQFSYYNWGYDPVQYNVPEGSYATTVEDPYSRVIELKQLIQAIHQANIRVNMDVVYNHMFDLPTSAFHQIMPGYYFRYGKQNELSNGSFCGNDIESSRLMVRRYIIDSCLRYINFYGFDGFRFDLMGIIDIDTMNLLRNKLDEIDPSIMLYGEGWNMPTLLDENKRASMINYKQLGNIGYFNDRYRDTLKGPHHKLNDFGFTSLNGDKTDDAIHCILASTISIGKYEALFDRPDISINYSACHDNFTLYDQLKMTFKDDEKLIKDISRLLTGILFISQGIPFLHGGQEFFYTKQGVENSYMSPDFINWFDWDLRDINLDTVNYVKGLIEIRKSFGGFRFDTVDKIMNSIKITSPKIGLINYKINYNDEEYLVLINATNKDEKFFVQNNHDILANKEIAGLKSLGVVSESVIVDSVSLMILKSIK